MRWWLSALPRNQMSGKVVVPFRWLLSQQVSTGWFRGLLLGGGSLGGTNGGRYFTGVRQMDSNRTQYY